MGGESRSDSSQQNDTQVVTENHNLQDNKLGLAGSDSNSIATSETDVWQQGNAGNSGSITITDNSDQAFHDAALLSMAAVKASEENSRAAMAAANASAARVSKVAGESVAEMGSLTRDTTAKAAEISRDSLTHYNVLSKNAFDMVTANAGSSAAMSERATNSALEFADNYTKDDASRNVDTLIKWGAGAAALIAGAVILR